MRITVIEVFRALNIEPTKKQAWAVGSKMSQMYRQAMGEEPPKGNRPKTSGGGSHCFALYPDTWEKRIKSVILTVVADRSRQSDLFGGGA